VRSVDWGDVPHRTHAICHNGRRVHRLETLRRGNSITVKRNGRTFPAGPNALLWAFLARSMGQWNRRSRSHRRRTLRLLDRYAQTLCSKQLAHQRLPPLDNAHILLLHSPTRTAPPSPQRKRLHRHPPNLHRRRSHPRTPHRRSIRSPPRTRPSSSSSRSIHVTLAPTLLSIPPKPPQTKLRSQPPACPPSLFPIYAPPPPRLHR